MLTQLPTDILIEITSYLDVKDCCNMKNVNKTLYNELKNVEKYIFINELRYINNSLTKNPKIPDPQLLKKSFYNYLETFCQKVYINARKSYLVLIYDTIYMDDINIRQGVLDFIKRSKNFGNPKINDMFVDMIVYFIKNKNLEEYDNKLNLIANYYFLQIFYYNNTLPKEHVIDFINSLTENDNIFYKKIAVEYAKNLISSNINWTFNEMYKISKHGTTLSILNKLIGYKVLCLKDCVLFDYAKLYANNDSANIELLNQDSVRIDSVTNILNIYRNIDISIIYNMIKYKMNYSENGLVSHNYCEIKKLLNAYNHDILKHMIKKENSTIFNEINVTNPLDNKKVNILSRQFKQIMKMFNDKEIDQVNTFVNNEYDRLYQQFFK